MLYAFRNGSWQVAHPAISATLKYETNYVKVTL